MTAWIIDLCFLLVVPSAVWTAPVAPTVVEHQREIEIRMPGVQPMDADVHLCFSTKEIDSTFYITGFHPKRELDRIGHIILYGCEEPGQINRVWQCMEAESEIQNTEQSVVCEKGKSFLYLASDQDSGLNFPEGIAVKVGKGSPIKWLVIRVHYVQDENQVRNNATDYSGIILTITDIRQPYLAGHYSFRTFVSHPADRISFVNMSCVYEDSIKLHVFAYNAHYHPPGKVAIPYRIRNDVWTEIGRVTDQQEQIYYNVTTPGVEFTVEFGDVLAVVYILVNDDNVTTHDGHNEDQQLWSVYLVFYVEGNKVPNDITCEFGEK